MSILGTAQNYTEEAAASERWQVWGERREAWRIEDELQRVTSDEPTHQDPLDVLIALDEGRL